MKILVTGGAGFIGSALVRYVLEKTTHSIVNVDSLTYAGNQDSLVGLERNERYFFERVNICNLSALITVFDKHQPDVVMHLAAESHVDRSIDDPSEFIQTNIIGTFNLLEVARKYWLALPKKKRNDFRFHHVSTDEVYGDLNNTNDFFIEETPYKPSSPYSASKASSDHLVRAWRRTYGFPVIITNCSNNYGPYQFPEKLIPNTIVKAINGQKIPVYGNGLQIRDWLFVDDHVRALYKVLSDGKIGETYNIGGHNEKTNIDVIKMICSLLEDFAPIKPTGIDKYEHLITYVNDRPGHDARYAIDASKIRSALGWQPKETFESGIRKTVQWYLENQKWWIRVQSGEYRTDKLTKVK